MITFLTEIMPGVFALGMLVVVCRLYGMAVEMRKVLTRLVGKDTWADVVLLAEKQVEGSD